MSSIVNPYREEYNLGSNGTINFKIRQALSQHEASYDTIYTLILRLTSLKTHEFYNDH